MKSQTIDPRNDDEKDIACLEQPRGTTVALIKSPIGSLTTSDRSAGAEVVVRDVSKEPLPYVGEAFVSALLRRPKRNPAEANAIEVSDALVDELLRCRHRRARGSDAQLRSARGAEKLDRPCRARRPHVLLLSRWPGWVVEGQEGDLVVSRGGIYSEVR